SVAQTYGFEHQRVRANDSMVLMINNTADHGGRLMSYLRDGKYSGGGFQYWLQKQSGNTGGLKRGIVYCLEAMNSPAQTNNFCKNVMGITAAGTIYSSNTLYPLD
ncbi:MAG: hypothetical protein LBG16_05290, partial [Elusimicrobiota bacterium]|nr:hypothetical protein [Elusimicrobiota bacterium]